jgi:excisionase family DNA binding protein
MAKMISLAEGAERLGLTVRRLQALCQQRRIPGARLIGGRAWLLPRDFKVTPGTRGPKR